MTYGEFTQKIDVIDLIINVLRDHEKTLDGLISRFEEHLDNIGARKPQVSGLSYIQAISAVESHVYTVKEALKPEIENILPSLKRMLIQNYVHSLNRRNMVPDNWVETLIQYGTVRLIS